MVFLQHFKKVIYQLDLFCSSQLLRYNSDTQYKTLTGGLLSLTIIVVIIVGFANMISNTLNRTSISSTLTTTKQSNPPLATLVPNKETMFMLGFEIQSLDLTYLANLTQTPQFFEVKTNIVEIKNGIPKYTPVTLEQCSYQHWSMLPEFNKHFDSFGISGWLCLPLNMPIPMQGTYTSPVSYEYQINVYPCQNDTQNGTCASQEEIDSLFSTYGNFYLTVNYVNPVINPNLQEYISYYIEGNDYVIFSETIGSQAWIYFSDYTIKTDNSIWPFSDLISQVGCIVEQKAINHPYTVTNNVPIVSLYLAKSQNSLVYHREVQKISAVFSYIGGLVGAITAIMFLIKTYTDSSLQITIGLNLFQVRGSKQFDEREHEVENFNFLDYISLAFYRIAKLVGWNGEWKFSERLGKYQDEAIKQMDVQLLLKRLIKLQSCMARLFTKEQLMIIREDEFITLEEAQKMRLLLLKDNLSEKMAQQESHQLQQQHHQKITKHEENVVFSSICQASNLESGMEFNRQPISLEAKKILISKNQRTELPRSFSQKEKSEQKMSCSTHIDQQKLNKTKEVKQKHRPPKQLPKLSKNNSVTPFMAKEKQ